MKLNYTASRETPFQLLHLVDDEVLKVELEAMMGFGWAIVAAGAWWLSFSCVAWILPMNERRRIEKVA